MRKDKATKAERAALENALIQARLDYHDTAERFGAHFWKTKESYKRADALKRELKALKGE